VLAVLLTAVASKGNQSRAPQMAEQAEPVDSSTGDDSRKLLVAVVAVPAVPALA
jgi:hypothetical protein